MIAFEPIDRIGPAKGSASEKKRREEVPPRPGTKGVIQARADRGRWREKPNDGPQAAARTHLMMLWDASVA